MIREIVKDEKFLSQKSEPATIEDKQIAIDLLDTLEANGFPAQIIQHELNHVAGKII